MDWIRHGGQIIAALLLSLPVFAQTSSASPVVLDRVIAIINGDVLLESDVREEMRMNVLQAVPVLPSQNTPERAAQRLITRTLILRQMKEQNAVNYSVSPQEAQQSLAEFRKQLPACHTMECTTEAGWQNFLAKNGLTEQEVLDWWTQRQEILKFIDQRFGVSIRISHQDIANYYQKNFLPAFAKSKQNPPSLESVAPRIRELLLQQQVNAQLRDWLHSLREQGSVQILDPKYGQSTNSDDDTGGGA